MKLLLVILFFIGVAVAQEAPNNYETSQAIFVPQTEAKKINKRSFGAWDPWGLTSHVSYSLPVVKISHIPSKWSSYNTLPSRGWSDPWYSSWPVVVKSNKWADNAWTW